MRQYIEVTFLYPVSVKVRYPSFTHPSWLHTDKATAKLVKLYAAYLGEPLTDIFNCTQVPKVTSPQNTTQLRNIPWLPLFDHVYESLLAQLMVSDMEAELDPGQFGN